MGNDERTTNTPARRRFFRSMAGEAAAFADEARGIPQLRLAELDTLPDKDLGAIVPAILPGVKIQVSGKEVQARVPGRAEAVPLFASDGQTALVFNGFNGRTSLADVAAHLMAEFGLEEPAAFARVRWLFLRLVRLGVCAPVNAG